MDSADENRLPALPAADMAPAIELVEGLFAEVADAPTASADDDFFELGGNSLTALAVVELVNDVFAAGCTIQTLFENPTPRAMVEAIVRAIGDRGIVRAQAGRYLDFLPADEAAARPPADAPVNQE